MTSLTQDHSYQAPVAWARNTEPEPPVHLSDGGARAAARAKQNESLDFDIRGDIPLTVSKSNSIVRTVKPTHRTCCDGIQNRAREPLCCQPVASVKPQKPLQAIRYLQRPSCLRKLPPRNAKPTRQATIAVTCKMGVETNRGPPNECRYHPGQYLANLFEYNCTPHQI